VSELEGHGRGLADNRPRMPGQADDAPAGSLHCSGYRRAHNCRVLPASGALLFFQSRLLRPDRTVSPQSLYNSLGVPLTCLLQRTAFTLRR